MVEGSHVIPMPVQPSHPTSSCFLFGCLRAGRVRARNWLGRPYRVCTSLVEALSPDMVLLSPFTCGLAILVGVGPQALNAVSATNPTIKLRDNDFANIIASS
jgi:hypothetical protein